MDVDHWFWWLLAWACVAWYATITFYVAFRGFFDIKQMLKHLADEEKHAHAHATDATHQAP